MFVKPNNIKMKIGKEIFDKKEHGDLKKINESVRGTENYVSLPTLVKAFKQKKATPRVYGVIANYYGIQINPKAA